MSGAVLLMDMGTGKTLTTIAVMGRAYLNEKIKKVLVVCPDDGGIWAGCHRRRNAGEAGGIGWDLSEE